MHDHDHPVICRYRKHRQLAHQEGGFAAYFPLDVLIVHSSMLTVIIDGECLPCDDFSLGETVCFESLEFIIDCFGRLSLSPRGGESGAIFVGATRSGSSSLRTMIEDSTDEFYTISSREGSSDLPVSQRCITGALPAPITTTPWPEDALATETMTMVPPRALALLPDIGSPLE
jgi:hypothetical protein